ncbi:MAG: GNAT family N-acetyltransferase [Sphingomonas sp.]|jgi:GNAT superfamily N-acetyltransferase
MSDTLQRLVTARRWFELLGQNIVETADAMMAVTPGHPAIWDGNFAYAKPGCDPAAFIAALDSAMAHTHYRTVMDDALTEPHVRAMLALAGFVPYIPNVEMLAMGQISPRRPPAAITLRPVADNADWEAMIPLIRADHEEGKRTGKIDKNTGDILIDLMRRDCPRNAYSLLLHGGEPVGYGMALVCPGGLGVLEHLFCRADRRGQGIMSAYIVQAAHMLRQQGCDGIFLDALSGETAKRLYASLGFAPVATTCRWARPICD